MTCSLCKSANTHLFYSSKKRSYSQCETCGVIFLHPEFYLNTTAEKERYDKHSDDIEDEGYQNFVTPLINAVVKNYSVKSHGLDYGCGKTAIVQYLLQKKGYQVAGFDPIYAPSTEVFSNTYDFITCCEVAEHFYFPLQEFKRLHQLLLPGGTLLLKTYLYDHTINFSNWWYKNDPTHVIFYTHESLTFIKEHIGFNTLQIFDDYTLFKV
ncbi:methyltransferase domain-containing protein [Aquimarina agarivorans]|uniref:methyltransferase domain-containing protein n=1 Tax=Aquimarina agarivorans TaxID=980584 RepID=UPI0002DFB8DA|nr:methyltransferase domain-containing protein [Aquimarina agarivorans]